MEKWKALRCIKADEKCLGRKSSNGSWYYHFNPSKGRINEPALEPIIQNPEFKKYFEIAKSRFWKTHEQLKETLKEKGLLRS
jgi:hypothetical protein